MGREVLKLGSKISLSALMIGALGFTASAQTSTTIVHQPVAKKMKPIVANSPEDIALQEEIRKIRAYNQYIDGKIGISEVIEVFEPVPSARTAPPKKVDLFSNMDNTRITYSSADGQLVSVTPVATRVQRMDVPSTVQMTHSYMIAEGDTLYGLAKANCVSVDDIQTSNHMSDANLRLGQNIQIPTGKCNVQQANTQIQAVTVKPDVVRVVMPVPTQTNVSTSASTANEYAVLPKDTLYSIGRAYCLSADQIASHNDIATDQSIHPGQILSVPEAGCEK